MKCTALATALVMTWPAAMTLSWAHWDEIEPDARREWEQGESGALGSLPRCNPACLGRNKAGRPLN
jgi:hypothetical protein